MKTFLLTLLSILISSSISAAHVPAKDLAFKSTGAATASGAWEMKSNGYLGTLIKVSKPGKVSVIVKVSGQDAVMHVHLGDARLAQAVRDGKLRDYKFETRLSPGTYWLRVELTNVAPGFERSLSVASITLSGAELRNTADDSGVLDAADTYIENYRKRPVELLLNDSLSKRLPVGTVVHVKLKRHAFNFGTALYGTDFKNGDWLKYKPAAGSDAEKYQQFVNTHFNMIVPENSGKWGACEGTRDVETMNFVDAMLAYARRNNLKARMHCVLWGSYPPQWVQELLDTKSKTELREEISERIKCLVKDRADGYVELDGINESAHQDAFLKMYGADGVGGIYDEIIAAANGRTRVYFNEFNLFQWSKEFGYKDEYGNWYKDHVESILNAGIKPASRDKIGIGIQYYPTIKGDALKYSPHSPVRIAQTLQLLSIFECPMSLTEFAAGDGAEAVAPKYLSDTMRLVFGTDQATSFLTWGFHKSHMWVTGSAFVDEKWNLTETGKTYEQLLGIKDWGIKDTPVWSTDLMLKTDKNSKISFTGFYGDYEITVNGKVYPLTIARGKGAHKVMIFCR